MNATEAFMRCSQDKQGLDRLETPRNGAARQTNLVFTVQ